MIRKGTVTNQKSLTVAKKDRRKSQMPKDKCKGIRIGEVGSHEVGVRENGNYPI